MKKIKDIIGNITKIEVGTWIRLGLLVLSLVNVTLRMSGINTIPFAPEDLADLISTLFTILVGVNAYWKNNSFTSAALAADEEMKRLRGIEDE